MAQLKKQQAKEKSRKEQQLLHTALRARNIRWRTTAQPPDMEDAVVHLAPDPLSPTSTLHFPVVLLYPLHAQSDFIKAFAETDTVPQHFEYILPLPWDEKKEYELKSVEYYMETSTAGLVKVGGRVSLGKILAQDGIEVVDGLVRVNVVPKHCRDSWIDTMKARRKP